MTEISRLFLAVVPPSDVITALRDLPSTPQRGVKWTRSEQWHITLKFLGLADEAEAIAALSRVDGRQTTATIGPAVSLLGTRIVHLPVSGLDDLAAVVQEPYAEIGEPQEPRDFAGHITLARLKGAPLKNPSTVSLLNHEFSMGFPVETIALVASELSNAGSSYETIAELELGPAD